MQTLFICISLIVMILGLILAYQSIKFTITMWKFKNRKKDGSEDKNFKYFD